MASKIAIEYLSMQPILASTAGLLVRCEDARRNAGCELAVVVPVEL